MTASVLASFTAFTCAASAQQLITYVNATHGAEGNTSIFNPATEAWEQFNPFIGQAGSDDSNWDFRAEFANSGIYQNVNFDVANQGGADSNPLRTTVTGLPESELGYNVFLYFWDARFAAAQETGPWQIRASLVEEGAPWPRFAWDSPEAYFFHPREAENDATIDSVDLDGGNPFTSSVRVAEADRRLIQVHLGTISGTEFSVFVDDGPATTGQNRTWYDGVGYSIVPEPRTYALLGGIMALFSVIFLRQTRRRRKPAV